MQGDKQVMSVDSALLSYAPQVYDQVLFVRSDDDLADGLWAVQGELFLDEVRPLLEQVDELVVWQYFDWIEQDEFTLLFFAVEDEFDWVQFQDSGILATGDGVTYTSLGNNMYVYGDITSRAYRDRVWGGFDQLPSTQEYLTIFAQERAHLAFFSQPEWLLGMENTATLAPFADALESSFAWSRLSPHEQAGALILTFAQPLWRTPTSRFTSRLAERFVAGQPLFLEIQQLLHVLQVSEMQFTSLLPVLVGGDSPYNALLSSNDMSILYRALNNNIALSITRSDMPGLAGVGVHLVFAERELFTVLQKFWPFIRSWLEEMLWVGGVRVEQWQDIWLYSLALDSDVLWTTQLLRLERTDDAVDITLLWSDDVYATPGDTTMRSLLRVPRDAFLAFAIDMVGLSNLSTVLTSGIDIFGVGLTEYDYTTGQPMLMMWHIDFQEWWRQLVISFSTQ